MADIIPINPKQRLADTKRAALARRRKILAVQKIFHCSHCASKCAKCGAPVGPEDYHKHRHVKSNVPYRLCDSCLDEYQNYILYLQGKNDPDAYWHNDAWMDAWRKWIDYQGAVDRYVRSKEFKQLLTEIRQSRFDE